MKTEILYIYFIPERHRYHPKKSKKTSSGADWRTEEAPKRMRQILENLLFFALTEADLLHDR